jgi:ribosome biogenesis SPOUT family RNA methylase Rps3
MPAPFRLAKLELRPGDMVVLQTDLLLDKDQVTSLKRRADEQLRPLKIKSMILVGGLKIGILRKAKAHDRQQEKQSKKKPST